MTTLTSKVMFHQVNSNLSTGVSVNLDYLLLAAVEKRELADKSGARTIYLKPSVRSGGTRLLASVFCHTKELLYHYYLYSFNLFISRTALSEITTYGKFVLHLRRVQQKNSVGCLSTRTAVFYSMLFVLYPMYVMQVVVLV